MISHLMAFKYRLTSTFFERESSVFCVSMFSWIFLVLMCTNHALCALSENLFLKHYYLFQIIVNVNWVFFFFFVRKRFDPKSQREKILSHDWVTADRQLGAGFRPFRDGHEKFCWSAVCVCGACLGNASPTD